MATADITSDTTVYPSENQVETTQYKGSRGQERWHAAYKNNFAPQDFRVSGLGLSDGGGLNVNVASGIAFIQGRRVATDGTNSVGLADNNTNWIYMKLTLDGSSNVSAVSLESNTTRTPPSNSVEIGLVVTSGGSVSSATSAPRPISHHPDNDLEGTTLNLREQHQNADDDVSTGIAEHVVATETITQASGKYKAQATVLAIGYARIEANALGGGGNQLRIKVNGATKRFKNVGAGPANVGDVLFMCEPFAHDFSAGTFTVEVTINVIGAIGNITIDAEVFCAIIGV